jgi:2-hydroxychromene-2-carboxylate isomerase
MSRPVLEFWYEFASTYSYLSGMRIEREAEKAGVDISWRPFLLGPIFAAQGWTTSPFNLYPAKGRYMWRDMEREAAALGLPCRQPTPFPQNSLLAARVALLGAAHNWGPLFTKSVFTAEFGEGRSISDRDLIADVLRSLGLEPDSVLAVAQTEENKARLRAQCDEARERGLFGAPSFITADREVFWGNDRLERALAWAARAGQID